MKKVLCVLLLIISTVGFGQDSSKTPVLDKTEQLVDKYSGKIASAFSSEMEAATPIAKQGFKTAVKLQIASGIAGLMPLLFFTVFFCLFISEYNKVDTILKSDKVPKNMSPNYGVFDNENVNAKIVLLLMLSSVMFILSLIYTYDGITHLIAPEWFAIKEIIQLVK